MSKSKRFTILAAALLPLATIWGGTAVAQVDVSNNTVICGTIMKGSLKFSPVFTPSGLAPSVIKIKGKLAGCITDAGVVIVDGKSKFSGVINFPDSNCSVLGTANTATGVITVKWKADQSITPDTSTINVASGGFKTGIHAGLGTAGDYEVAFGLGSVAFPASPGTALSVGGAFTGGTGGANSFAALLMQEDIQFWSSHCLDGAVKGYTIGVGQLYLG